MFQLIINKVKKFFYQESVEDMINRIEKEAREKITKEFSKIDETIKKNDSKPSKSILIRASMKRNEKKSKNLLVSTPVRLKKRSNNGKPGVYKNKSNYYKSRKREMRSDDLYNDYLEEINI